MERVLIILCIVLFFSNCSNKTTADNSKNMSVEQDSVSVADSELMLDTLDIKLFLPNKILDKTTKKIDFTIRNNSAYTLLLDTIYSIKYLEFGFYGDIPFPKDVVLISTTEPHIINSKESSKVFTAYFEGYDFSFPPGYYKITQEVSVLDINAENNGTTVIGRMVLEADFEIK
jgi:hypothetical protein